MEDPPRGPEAHYLQTALPVLTKGRWLDSSASIGWSQALSLNFKTMQEQGPLCITLHSPHLNAFTHCILSQSSGPGCGRNETAG